MATKQDAIMEDASPSASQCQPPCASEPVAAAAEETLNNKRKNRFQKGIVDLKRPKKENGLRPKNARYYKEKERQVLINGCALTLRQCRSFVMFEIETFAVLLSKSLPLRMTFGELHTMVAAYAKARRPQMTAEAKAWRHEFLSWKSFKHFLEHNLHDQCLRDVLRTYVPRDDSQLKFDGSLGLGNAPVTFLGSETDFIKIAGITIPFVVKCGKIYFDLFPAFTLMGQLQVALNGDWREIDSMLVDQGFNLKTAFRINANNESYKTWRSLRSAITYDGFKALIKSDVVPHGERKDRLLAIIEHLDTDMMGLTRAREDLVQQLQAVVDDHVQITIDPLTDEMFEVHDKDKVLTGTEICYRGCGRYYHYSIRCCDEPHKIKFSGQQINYIVQKGRLFIDKCSAFSLLDKISVVRHCDFRTVDKILARDDLNLNDHFLNEKETIMGRRTHVSFQAMKALEASPGFCQATSEGKIFMQKIEKNLGFYLSKCSKMDCKSSIIKQDSSDEESSSGIESGGASDDSGKNSPTSASAGGDTNESEKEDSKEEFVETIMDGKFTLHLSLDHKSLYCDIADFQPLIGGHFDNEELTKILKRRYRCVDVDQSFRPRMFQTPSKASYFSVKCFKLLLAKNYIKTRGSKKLNGAKVREIVAELDQLLAKYTKDCESDEDDDDLIPQENDDEQDVKPDMSSFQLEHKDVTVKILDHCIPFQVKDRNIYLDRRMLLSELLFIHSQVRNNMKMDEILKGQGISIDKSFIGSIGKNRKFISIPALKALIKEGYLSLKKPELKEQMEATLDKLNKDKNSLLAKKVLHLASFEAIPYKLSRGTIFLSTLAFLRASGLSEKYLKCSTPSKAYSSVVALLKKRGMEVKGCFLKQGICKYGYISIKAAFALFKLKSGPFRNKKRMRLLAAELHRALKKFPSYKSYQEVAVLDEVDGSSVDVVSDTITIGDIKVKYQVKDGVPYFHRMAIFEAIGLEKALIVNFKGMNPINKILQSHKLEVGKSYLKSHDEQYAFISFTALWTILDAEDPLVTMLERRLTFCTDLLNLVEKAVVATLTQNNKSGLLFEAIPWHVDGKNGKFMLHKRETISCSGIIERAPMLASYPEYIQLSQLMKFTRLESDQERSSGYSNLIWTDMISAVMHETPKLRIHVKLIEFRQRLMKFLEQQLVVHLQKPDAIRSDNQPLQANVPTVKTEDAEIVEIIPEEEEPTAEGASESEEKIIEEVLQCNENEITEIVEMSEHNDDETSPESSLSLEEFSKIEESVRAIRSGIIGDWHVKRCDSNEIRLIVNPGYGASKKISFVQPDVSAILKYELCLRPMEAAQLSINDLKVPYNLIEPIILKELKRGLFGLLYNFLTLRPCFGNFQPELVETLEKRSRINMKNDVRDLVIDTNFIGSSQNGRTYAGTVRSKECTVLALTKVSDLCHSCSNLQCGVVINRSVLASPKKAEVGSSSLVRTLSQDSSHQSVWKIENSSEEGCTFVCPQLQSYNTSLPHQFVSSSQASSVVEHRVFIAQDLTLQVSLNNKGIIGKTFSDFEKTKQVGPLLDAVASMRMCVGYPDPLLVDEAKYLMLKKTALPNEIKKFFNYITIDEDFHGKMNSIELKGTMRANSCRFVASDHADICDQCRLLQEPLNFLGL